MANAHAYMYIRIRNIRTYGHCHPYMLDQKPRLLIFSSRSRRRPLFENSYNSRAATIRERPQFLELSTSTSICILFCIFYNPQFKSSIKTSFFLGGSHTYQSGIRYLCYYVRTLRTIIIIKASRGYYSRAATILLSSPIELYAATKREWHIWYTCMYR